MAKNIDNTSHLNYSPMNKMERLTYIILVITGIFAFFRYFAWWFLPSHIPSNWLKNNLHFLDLLVFLTLSFVIFFAGFLKIGTWFTVWFIKRPKHVEPHPNLKVAFITCFVPGKEPIEMLKKTLVAMCAADYPHDTWVLDEGDDFEVKKLCKELGVKHFSRKNKPHYNQLTGSYRVKTKAGNLNSWRNEHEHNYDIVAQLDMDHVPHKDYLTRQLGYFTDPKVGYVVAPQIYKNTDNWIARGAAEQTYYYYGPLQQGLYGAHMPFLIGTTHVYRVQAMKSFGGYSPTIAEDYLTCMHFLSNGWRGVYVPEVLAEGIGPTTWIDYFNQQMRWSYGLYEILLKHTHKHFFKLKIRQKINLFFSQLFYFSGLATVLGFILTSLYLVFGINSSNIQFSTWITYSLPAYLSTLLILLFLHRYYVNPKKEPAIGVAGMLLTQAAGVIYTVALLKFILRRKLTYKITAKGEAASTNTPISSLNAHIFILLISMLTILLSIINHHDSIVMRFWAGLNILFVGLLVSSVYWDIIKRKIDRIFAHYKFFEFKVYKQGFLPSPPTDKEKYIYIEDNRWLYTIFSIISFTSVQVSLFGFISNNILLWPLLLFLILTIIYFLISLLVNSFSRSFDFNQHKIFTEKWLGKIHSSIDVFLPTAGESLDVLENTWNGVRDLVNSYNGKVTVYCLDDSARNEVKILAKGYKFKYVVRPDRGYFKKAGNLRHGYNISNGEFVVIFDADFTPRKDFFDELMPYFYENPSMGIVQSPQYFDIHSEQNWLQRGAGAVQELFYRFCQVSRQSHDASICVGTNAIYRRKALQDTGGTALIEHSEDVHTGFNIRMHGWTIQYVPIILAKGLCPSDMKAFFKQQYRWCLGSMSLLTSDKFVQTKISLMARLSYFSGFLYYIHTALSSLFIPLIPLVLLIIYPDQITLHNYLFILPSLIFVQMVYPIWHNAVYGIEAWSTRTIYGWAHLFAITDSITGRTMSWQTTGTKMDNDTRYTMFRILQFVFNFIPATIWVALASLRFYSQHNALYIPLLLGGLYFLLITSKVTFYKLNIRSILNIFSINKQSKVLISTGS